MTARKKIFAGLALFVIVGSVAWEYFHTYVPDPICQGKHLSYWLDTYELAISPSAPWVLRPASWSRTPTNPRYDLAAPAIGQAGTNAIPLLLRCISAHSSPVKWRIMMLMGRQHLIKSPFVYDFRLHYKAVQGFLALGPEGKPALPELIRIYDSNLSMTSQEAVLQALWAIGPDAKDALPVLASAVTNSNGGHRELAARALGRIRVQPEVVVPLLTNCLNDPHAPTRLTALEALGNLGPAAKAAVPQLLELRHGTSDPSRASWTGPSFLAAIDDALKDIDPAAAANAGIQ